MRRTRIATPDRRGPRLSRTPRRADRIPPPFVRCASSLLAALERAPLPSYNPPMTYARVVAYASLAALLAFVRGWRSECTAWISAARSADLATVVPNRGRVSEPG